MSPIEETHVTAIQAALDRSYLFRSRHATRPNWQSICRWPRCGHFDLEDAVGPADKDRARATLVAALDPLHPVIVRINGFGSPWFERDLDLCCRAGISAVMVPKAEAPEHLQAVHARCGRAVLALIETARGLWNALAIARTLGVQRIAFGALDFRLDLGLPDAGYGQLASYRSQLVLASRVAGIAPPVDSPTPALDDETRVRADSLQARNLGFGGKLCIQPNQVPLVNAAFVPTLQEIEWATRVVATARASNGAALALDGKMIDRPVIDLAERILAEDARRPSRV